MTQEGWEHLTQAQARRRALGQAEPAPERVSRPGSSRRRQLGLAARTHDGLRATGLLASGPRPVRVVNLTPRRATTPAKGGRVMSCGCRVSMAAAAAEGFLRCPSCGRRATLAY
jgi:hypothetical protein